MILSKIVVNLDGGTAQTNAFTLTASGPSLLTGAGYAESDVNAGTYDLSETILPGYTASDWECTGGTQGTQNLDQITLALGESASCVITNDDIPPMLTLVKKVINDDSGTAGASNWTLYATGDGGFSGQGTANPDDSEATLGPNNVLAGVTYTLSESGPADYSASVWTCTDDLGNPVSALGSQITLGLADNVTCEISNNDIPPQPGTGTPGYWLNHPEVWDGLGDDDIVYINMSLIGGQPGILIGDWNNNSVCDGDEECLPLTLDDALEYLKPDKGDKRRTLARSLVAAWLNVLAGNEDDCIHGTVNDSVVLLETYPTGPLKGKDAKAFWETDGGKDLHTTLDKYNNGMLCAPHRDSSDLMLVKAAPVNDPAAGDSLQYIITISNSGPANATDVTVTDTLDDNLTFNATLTSGYPWTCSNVSQLVTCTLGGEIPVGDTAATLNIGVDVNSSVAPGTVIWNWAEVASQEPEYYGRELNNNDSVSITIGP